MLRKIQNLLRPPETKTSRTAQVIAFEAGRVARWFPRDFTTLAREGYCRNAVVYRAVRMIAESVGSLTLVAYEGDAPSEPHALTDLLARPNPRQDGAAFLELLTTHLLLAGNSYVEAVAVGDTIRELYVLRPDRMRVLPGAQGWPEAYEYTAAGRTVRFTQDANVPPILHVTLAHPLDDHYGLSPSEAAAVAIELSLIECPAFALTLLQALWVGRETSINGFASLSGLLMAYFAARFGVLGVYVTGRSREKQVALTGENTPSIVAEVLKALRKK